MQKKILSLFRIIALFILGISPVYFNYLMSDHIKAFVILFFLVLYYYFCKVHTNEAIVLFLIFSMLIKFNYVITSYLRISHILFLIFIIMCVLPKIEINKSIGVIVGVVKNNFIILNILFLLELFIGAKLNSINLWDSYRVISVYLFSFIVYLGFYIYIIDKTTVERRKIIFNILEDFSLVLSILGIAILLGYAYFNIWDSFFNVIPTGTILRLHFSEDPNYYASFILPGIVILLFKSLNKTKSEVFKLGFLIIAFILTFSLGNYIALVFTIFAFGLFYLKKKKTFKFKIIPKRYIFVLIFALVFSLPFTGKKIIGIIQQKQQSGSERINVWKDALTMNSKSPETLLLGVGSDNAKYNTTFYKQTGYSRDIHNSYLQLYSETGILGTVLFFSILFLLFKKLIKYNSETEIVIVSSVLLDYFFIGLFNVYFVWFILFLFNSIYTEEGYYVGK